MISSKIASLEARLARLERTLNKTAAMMVQMVDPVSGGILATDTIENFKRDNMDNPQVLSALQQLKSGLGGVTIKTPHGGSYILRRPDLYAKARGFESITNEVEKDTIDDVIDGIESVYTGPEVIDQNITSSGVKLLIENDGETERVQYTVEAIGDQKYSFTLILLDRGKRINNITKEPFDFGRYIVDKLR
jgi:hypothetical protein